MHEAGNQGFENNTSEAIFFSGPNSVRVENFHSIIERLDTPGTTIQLVNQPDISAPIEETTIFIKNDEGLLSISGRAYLSDIGTVPVIETFGRRFEATPNSLPIDDLVNEANVDITGKPFPNVFKAVSRNSLTMNLVAFYTPAQTVRGYSIFVTNTWAKKGKTYCEPPEMKLYDTETVLSDYLNLWLATINIASISGNPYALAPPHFDTIELSEITYESQQPATAIDRSKIPAITAGGRALALARQESEKASEEVAPLTTRPRFEDLAGMHDAKERLQLVVDGFKHADLYKKWGQTRPQGVLIYGEQGTGKTTLAHALATEIDATVKLISPKDIEAKYYGDSGQRLAKLFDDAMKAEEPVVLLFDEIDSMLTTNDRSGLGQVHKAEVAVFKQKLEEIKLTETDVLVVGTTNDRDAIDQSIIRSGRFDVQVPIGKPTEVDRAEIWSLMLSRLAARTTLITDGELLFDNSINALELAKYDGLNGADIENCFKIAVSKKIHQEIGGQTPDPLSQADLIDAITRFKSS